MKTIGKSNTSKNFSTTLILIPILSLFHLACPDPPDTTDCGDRQVKVNGECECEAGYHWNEDQTKCLMDTTGHDFVWEIDTLGISGSLRDVQIIDENNVWVVGEIETDSGKYGGAHWNGDYWELKKLKGPGIPIQTITPRGLWYFSEDNIWFASGSIFHWDGVETSMVWSCCDINIEETTEKIWASSENDIYFVGRGGAIVHYDGTTFTKMESPTTQDLDGIVGVVDSETGEKRIWAYGWTDYPNRGLLLQSDGTDWEVIWDENNPFFEDEQYVEPNLWVNEHYLVAVVAGSNESQISIHTISDIQDYKIIHNDTEGWSQTISGINENDLFFAGQFGNIFHFNGSTIEYYSIPEISDDFYFLGSDMNNDMILIVSLSNYILKGYRVN